jgi:FAD:protein FMN transferase
MSTATALPQRHVEHCMGTVFSIDVRAPGVDGAAVARVVEFLHWVDETFSTYRPESAVSRLRRGEVALRDCPPEVAEVLDRCRELSVETDGYFDCRAGGVLDPSGFVKGWAIERASDLLAVAGSVNHCVNGGGDVQCTGQPAPGRPWRVGIADPSDPRRLVATVTGDRLAVATSGTAQRGAHIVDPRTGATPTAFRSVTVVGTSLALVDAYATAAFAAGADAPRWLRGRGLRALLVDADGRLTTIEPPQEPATATIPTSLTAR